MNLVFKQSAGLSQKHFGAGAGWKSEGRERARYRKFLRVRGGFKTCGAGADQKFQPAQDSNAQPTECQAGTAAHHGSGAEICKLLRHTCYNFRRATPGNYRPTNQCGQTSRGDDRPWLLLNHPQCRWTFTLLRLPRWQRVH